MELDRWWRAAAEAAADVARGPLGIDQAAWHEVPVASLPAGLWGACISLRSARGECVQLGLLTHRSTCERLARTLLGMAADEALGSDTDVIDAVRELANLVAGGIKARLEGTLDVRLGLPRGLSGQRSPGADAPSAAGLLELEQDQLWLVVSCGG